MGRGWTRDRTAEGAGMSEVFVIGIMMDRMWSDFCILRALLLARSPGFEPGLSPFITRLYNKHPLLLIMFPSHTVNHLLVCPHPLG